MSLGREACVSHTISTHYRRHTRATSLAHSNECKDCSMHEASHSRSDPAATKYMQITVAPLKQFPRVSRGWKFLADHPFIRFQCEPSYFLLYIFWIYFLKIWHLSPSISCSCNCNWNDQIKTICFKHDAWEASIFFFF